MTDRDLPGALRDLLAIRWMKSRALRYEIAESVNCL